MNFSSMEYFTVLARERSFTRAAEKLHITQQSLSAHIAGMEQELRQYLEAFSHISVRETQGREIIREVAGRETPVVLDPTLLLDRARWETMAHPPQDVSEGGYILCYCINKPAALTPYITALAERTGLPVVQLCGIRQKVHPKAKCVLDAGPAEFLGLFRNAAYVCTNSFHGTVFATQFQKPFFTVVAKDGNRLMVKFSAICSRRGSTGSVRFTLSRNTAICPCFMERG